MNKKTIRIIGGIIVVVILGAAIFYSQVKKAEGNDRETKNTPVETMTEIKAETPSEVETPLEIKTPVETLVETPVETSVETPIGEVSTPPAVIPTETNPNISVIITSKQETKTEAVGYETVKQYDSTMAKGREVVVQNGVNGVRTMVQKITLTDGKETARTTVSSTITKAPISKIIKIGTKAAATTPKPAPVITTKDETKTQAIAFETIRQNDPTLEEGKTVVAQVGVNGVRTIVTRVTYIDGVATSRREISNTVTKNPVNKVVKVGTKEPVPELSYIETKVRQGLPSGYTTSPCASGGADIYRGGVYVGTIKDSRITCNYKTAETDIKAMISGASTMWLNKSDALNAWEEFSTFTSAVVYYGTVEIGMTGTLIIIQNK